MTEQDDRIFRKRLRPAYSERQLQKIYSRPHKVCKDWIDHKIRLKHTLELGDRLISSDDVSGADLSAGDGYILNNLPLSIKLFGDFAPGYQYVGPIEETIHQIPNVDVFVCCETLEHLDQPDTVLLNIRAKSAKLLLSTPIGENTDDNPEHYWGWNKRAVKIMLKGSGWMPILYDETVPPIGYKFQIWGCI